MPQLVHFVYILCLILWLHSNLYNPTLNLCEQTLNLCDPTLHLYDPTLNLCEQTLNLCDPTQYVSYFKICKGFTQHFTDIKLSSCFANGIINRF